MLPRLNTLSEPSAPGRRLLQRVRFFFQTERDGSYNCLHEASQFLEAQSD